MALFLKFEDMVTTGRGNDGLVLGGRPVSDAELGKLLGQHEKTIGKHRRRLKNKGYIELKRTPIGYSITVKKSKKVVWRQWSQNAPSREQNAPSREPFGSALETDRLPAGAKSLHPDQTVSVHKQDKAASQPANDVWIFLKIAPCGPPQFQRLLENRWASRTGERSSILIGETIDRWVAATGDKPHQAGQLFQALHQLRDQEKRASSPLKIHVLTPEEIPA